MKNITLSADEKLIEAARDRARAEHTTLNEQFREWLASYARERSRIREYDTIVAALKGRLRVGRKLSRDEMNER
jgi:cbb3-type cytochrome oxidase cytochrome c subunit